MFHNYYITQAAVMTALVAVAVLLAGIFFRCWHNLFCENHITNFVRVTKKIKIKATILKLTTLIAFSLTGLCLGNLIGIALNYNTALSHGMIKNPDTGIYDLTYGEIIYLNRNSIKESDVNINDLKNKAIIYIRYDCPDCVALHEQLAALDDMIFLSSRSEKGKDAQSLYTIYLTEVPQGVYIDSEGKATVIDIMQGSGKEITLDLQQISILREMVIEPSSINETTDE